MLSATNFEQIYAGMIAGRVANHDGDAELSIFYLARDLLGTDNLHLLTSKSPDNQFIYYLAQKSSAFSSAPVFETPLVAALPGNLQHKGDGAYLLSHGSISVAVIKDGDKFRLITNNTDAVESEIDDMELLVHPAESFVPALMQSITGKQRHQADKFSARAIKLSAILSSAAIVLGVVASVGAASLSASLKNRSDQNAIALGQLVSKIDHASPLSRQLAGVQKISATVVRAGGWIESYELAGEKEKFVVALPEWVTQDFIRALGPGAQADHDAVNNLIKVHKD